MFYYDSFQLKAFISNSLILRRVALLLKYFDFFTTLMLYYYLIIEGISSFNFLTHDIPLLMSLEVD